MADTVDHLRAEIVRAHPELEASSFRFLAEGWHSTAVEVDGRLIFKFPKDRTAEAALLREAALLSVIRPRVSLPVPEMRIHRGSRVFSRHEKLPGGHLLADGYRRLSETARDRLATTLGGFYAELHGLDIQRMTAAGALPVEGWQSPAAVRARALPRLARGLRDRAAAIVAAFESLPADPHGTTYGFFDGHGWNMAFDHARGRLNGIYDFADSGIGPLHQEFIYTNFISRDLTARVIAAYETRTGRSLDRRRIGVLTGYHRLSELAELADDPQHAPDMVRHFGAWAAEPL